MVIDTSALVAIVLDEPSRDFLRAALQSSSTRIISSVSLLEAGIVLRAREGQLVVPKLYGIVEELGITTVVFDEAQAKAAIGAFARFGKGMGHRAQLNFGDCAVYALAAMRGEPLLATGSDFAATDLTVIGPTSGSCGGTRADGV
jgi:ribonuclease VapC